MSKQPQGSIGDDALFISLLTNWHFAEGENVANFFAALVARIDSRTAAPAETPKHSDDSAVDRFAAAMKRKMASSRAKGRNGWDNEALCPTPLLQTMLADHLAKGDPVDVGNFAMMLFNRDERAALAAGAPVETPKPDAALLPAVLALNTAIHQVLIAGGDYGDDLSDIHLRDALKKAQHVAFRALISIGIEKLPGAVNPLSAFLPAGESTPMQPGAGT